MMSQSRAFVTLCTGVFAMSLAGHFAACTPGPACPPLEEDRVDCFPEGRPSKAACYSRGCCWAQTGSERGPPTCFFPKHYGYEASEVPVKNGHVWRSSLSRIETPSLYGNDVKNIEVHIEEQSRNRLRIKFYDPNKPRFEVPYVRIPNDKHVSDPLYSLQFILTPFAVRVFRKKNNQTIFDSSMGGFVFSDQFLQLSSKLASPHVYGLGEHLHTQLKHDIDWRVWPIHAAGKHPTGPEAKNMFGVHPVYLNVEENGEANMVLFLNQHAMEVVLQPKPAVTFRTIGGILDFYIFLSGDGTDDMNVCPSKDECALDNFKWKPSPPVEVNQLYIQAIGLPPMPPYWALGFQLSRWEYKGSDDLKNVIKRTREAGIPYDVQWGDIDYMVSAQSFTIDTSRYPDLPEIVADLHQSGQKYIAIHHPGIKVTPRGEYPAYDDGCDKALWVTHPSGEALEGKVRPGTCVFPDYTKDETVNWWVEHALKFHKRLPHDGFWIDVNEPTNFGSPGGCQNNTWNHPPYLPNITGGLLWERTLCMDSVQALGRHYDLHSLYGHTMANATWRAARAIFKDKRSLIVSRSTFVGSGQFASKWLGDNKASYDDMKWSITGMIEMNMFGFPYVGADICGFFNDTSEDLCQRWMQLGAFYTMSRSHNKRRTKDQDPAAPRFSQAMVASSRKVLLLRYSLLPYLYTLFYHAHTRGDTVIRPLAFEFPLDNEARSVDRQFLWGSALLISPTLDMNQSKLQAYIPEGRWYDFFTGEEIRSQKWQMLEANDDTINLHIRGGYILPMQIPDVTTTKSRRKPMSLVVALNHQNEAGGTLFLDDGETLDTHHFIHLHRKLYLHAERGELLIDTDSEEGAYDPEVKLDAITLLGLEKAPTLLTLTTDGATTRLPTEHVRWHQSKKLTIVDLQLDLTKIHRLTWNETGK